MQRAEQERILTQGREPIEQPVICKEDAGDYRLTSPRTLLGLDLEPEDRIVPPRGTQVDKQTRTLTDRGMLKDKSWKLLLVS